jgi:hypothetical protein
MDKQMKRLGFAEASLHLAEGVAISFKESLEVSLDCASCRRRWRTVIFAKPGQPGRCTPTGHAFEGRLLKVTSTGPVARFDFEYEYRPFVDEKHPERQAYGDAGAPTWARIGFMVTCPACGRSKEESTQSNLVRPWRCRCSCGATLFDDLAPPRTGWSQPPDPG